MYSEKEQNPGRRKNFDRGSKLKPALCMTVLCMIALILLVILFRSIFAGGHSLSDRISENIAGSEGKVETISDAYIQKVFEISELSTAEYTYNSIARIYEDDGTAIRYYVAYEGLIKAGIDFSEIEARVDHDNKVIAISLPEITVQETTVDPGSLDFIFVDKKSETENVHKEAFEFCQKDLEEKARHEDELLSLARTNAETVVKALITPWVNQVDSDFTINIE